MIVKTLLPVFAAVGAVVAQTNVCSQPTVTINSPADASTISSCQSISGDVVIGNNTGNTIDISGPATIGGSLTCLNNGGLITFGSTTLRSIGANFTLTNLTIMSTLSFPSLTGVGMIDWTSLNALSSLTFTSRVTSAKGVTISDTFLSTLDGIDLSFLDGDMNINNNLYLTEFSTQLGNLSGTLTLQANGRNLAVDMPNLIWINNMDVSNVTNMTAPSLLHVNGSARFDSNYFSNFLAPNLTGTGSDLAFISNANLANMSFPVLKTVGGGFTIANNTGLQEINGFPDLTTIGGAVLMTGNFSSFEFPDLNDVKGAFTVASTTDISSSCNTVKALAPSKQGGNGDIQGVYNCTSNDATANSNTGNSSSGGSGGSGNNNTASGVTISTYMVLSLAALAGVIACL